MLASCGGSNINLNDRPVKTDELHGEDVVRVGRHFIAKTRLKLGAAKVDLLSPENPLIFSAGPFAGSELFSPHSRIKGAPRSGNKCLLFFKIRRIR